MQPHTGDLLSLVQERTAAYGDKELYVFLKDGEVASERLTYSAFDLRVRTLGARLAAELPPDSRVILLLPPGLDFPVAFFACIAAQMIPVPVASQKSLELLSRVQEDSGASAVLTTQASAQATREDVELWPALTQIKWLCVDSNGTAAPLAPAAADPNRLAFLQYTSGSLSDPKGVAITHGNVMHNLRCIQSLFAQDEPVRSVSWLPHHHDMGLVGGLLEALYLGSTTWLMPPLAFIQRPVRWLRAITALKANISGGPHFAYDLCVKRTTEAQKAQLDLSSWNVAYNGAEPIRAETLRRFSEAFASCGFRPHAHRPLYGMAEATLLISGPPQREPASVVIDAEGLAKGRGLPPREGFKTRELVGLGGPADQLQVELVDPETGTLCEDGTVGELWVRGPSIAQGYWNRAVETAEVFKATLSGSPGFFLRTGDLGLRIRNELYVCGRKKDVIIRDGRKFFAVDIESFAEAAAGLDPPLMTAAFALELGEVESVVLVAEVRRRVETPEARGAMVSALRRGVSEHLALRLDRVVLVPYGDVPRTTSGKVQRHRCRNRYLAGELRTLLET